MAKFEASLQKAKSPGNTISRVLPGLCDDPYGNRTRVTAVKGRCPRPLDEGAVVEKPASLASMMQSKPRFGLTVNPP